MKLLDQIRSAIQRGRAFGWLALTALQALATCGFLALAYTCQGGPWQKQAWSLALTGIVATWCLALRAIREKILELLALWMRSAKGLLYKPSRSGAHQIQVTLGRHEVTGIQRLIYSLRWIAAGITIPFLVMPIFTGVLCMALCWRSPHLLEPLLEWVLLGPLLTMMAAAYFVWVIVPAPARVRIDGSGGERLFPSRAKRRGWLKEYAAMSQEDVWHHEGLSKIERDHGRFRQIVRGKIKKELRKYMTSGELIGKKGKDLVSIPLPQIDLPHFRFGSNQGGVGSGEGDPGDPLGGPPQPGDGEGEAGDQPGEHALEVDISLDELAKILGEELALPHIKPRGKKTILAEKERYNTVRRQGPESLRHFKRTFIRALRRQIALGTYDPKNPRVIPVKEDKIYKSWQITQVPETNAVIFYMMDVSGSMGDEQKEIVRTASFWIDTWLRSQYKSIESRYITHDAAAREVDQETFYKTRESGGTAISTAYKLCADLVSQRYAPSDWNVYAFHFSDGDNLLSDNELCFKILQEDLLPRLNLFCYGQVRSLYGSGEFKRKLDDALKAEHLITADIRGKEEIYDAIKIFLGKGK